MYKRFFNAILLMVLLVIIFLGILPIISLFILSFSAGWKWPEIIPHSFSFRAWKYILSNRATIKAIGTSFQIALIVMIINLIIAVPAGDALGRYDFRGKNIIEMILLLPIIVPPIVVMMGMHRSFIILNLTESIFGTVLAHIIPTLPYMIRAMTISFRNLGFSWEEQAKMLGAGRINRFFYVNFYFLLPGIIAGSSLTILISLSQYIITILIGGGNIVTLPILMFPYINGGDQAIGAAYSILFALTALLSLWIMDSFLKKYYE
jgi:putative spermidine/putrescine transport system permease protein